MAKRRGVSRLRWLALGILTAFLVVQGAPYAALAHQPPGAIAYRSTPPLDTAPTLTTAPATLLAQLHDLPNHTVALPNFELSEDTFQFSNRELIQAIDLERNAAAWEEVLTEQLRQLFGTQVCIGQLRTCVLTSAAQDWLKTYLGRMDQGLAEGMAAAVLSLWQPQQPRQIPWWQQLINFLLGRIVFGLARTLFELQTFIANLFLMQNVSEVFQLTQDTRENLSPTQILLTLLDIFLTGSLDPFTMGIYRVIQGVLTEGHALTPYQVEERGDGKYWVYVYDSNFPVGQGPPPADLHVEFDTVTDTWTYQPIANTPAFKGDTQSKNLDLTRLSWRQVETQPDPPYKGPFTCPFCRVDTTSTEAAAPQVNITLMGEGLLTVTAADDGTSTPITLPAGGERVPFKGGLNREVPASYRLPETVLNKPLKVTLQGVPAAPQNPITLQITGPGYTANFENLPLPPDETLTMYVIPNTTGPELTFVTNRAVEIPKLTIHLADESDRYEFDSSTAAGFSLTERQVSKSSGFELGGLKLPAGKRVALSAKGDAKQLYFADDDETDSNYTLRVQNRIVIQDRIQVGERRPDFINYTLTYEEDMRARDIQVDGGTQAVFDYDPAFIDPAQKSRDELLSGFEQRDFPITIALQPLRVKNAQGPLQLASSGAAIAERVFSGSLRKNLDK